jgi:hypothetical protein
MKIIVGRILISLFVSACASAAMASPLDLSYSIADTGSGFFEYDFTLTLDDHDNSWVAGQDFNWITFGDATSSASPLTNFVGDVAPAPFTSFSASSGYHNGPTLLSTANNFAGWAPTAVGDSLSWSGSSSAFLGQGQLLFSNLIGSGVHADFEVATLAVPEPSTYALMFAGLGAMGFLARRRKA